MGSRNNSKNIFADKASIIPRMLLIRPGKKWTVRDFTGPGLLSIGMAQEVLESLEKNGYIERVRKGPYSFSLLTNEDRLICDWLKSYEFNFNTIHTFYSHDKNILNKINNYFGSNNYALTNHCGANLITSYVKTEDVYFYINSDLRDKDLLKVKQSLDLKELKSGGNIHIVKPYYKHSLFLNLQTIKGFKVVSNLQLYLDLYNFRPRGQEHAEYLMKLLKEKGKNLV